jgi:2-polyprenyl-6-methoxyphenol hydroxylase-like FAD-dependent oxidoreductase
VLERAPAFGEVGAGLAVTANGMTALAALGLDEAVRAAGYQTAVAGYQDQKGRWLMRLPVTNDPAAVTTMCEEGVAERVPEKHGRPGHPAYLYTLAAAWRLPPR